MEAICLDQFYHSIKENKKKVLNWFENLLLVKSQKEKMVTIENILFLYKIL